MLQVIGTFLAGDHAYAIYWAFAIAGTAIFALTGLLNVFGAGSIGEMPSDVDVDMDGELDIPHPDTGFADFKMLSLRTALAFITMFGWGGVAWGRSGWIGFLAAFLCGLVMMILTALVIWLILRMQQSGNVENAEFVGKTGTVYLKIGAGRSRAGKVTVNLGSATREVAAFADDEIPKGTPVIVKQYLGSRVFLVEKR